MNIAVLIPCYNEEKTIAAVIEDFHKYLPDAKIYVYNNNCTDDTMEIVARYDYCVPGFCGEQGKGATVRKMFKEIDADVYVIADGDTTYPAKYANKLIHEVVVKKCDMVLGERLSSNYYADNDRRFHGIGNKLVKFLVNFLYHGHVPDIMTGYRAFSRRFVKDIDLKSDGFEVETEMTIFALKHNYKISSMRIKYGSRPDGSVSKINTVADGMKIISYIIKSKFFC